jgi:hypothetical protein
MTLTRITISLNNLENAALRRLAQYEFRDPRAQAVLIIRQELERRGLLETGLKNTKLTETPHDNVFQEVKSERRTT